MVIVALISGVKIAILYYLRKRFTIYLSLNNESETVYYVIKFIKDRIFKVCFIWNNINKYHEIIVQTSNEEKKVSNAAQKQKFKTLSIKTA